MTGTWVRICFCLSLVKGLLTTAEHVTGSENDNLTLPCKYSVSGGATTMCWGKGSCPLIGCGSAIIWTDGNRVTWGKSDRYQLPVDITQGDVSLTITEVTEEDEGTYCCRVEIPGMFNDQIKKLTVKLQEGSEDPSFIPRPTAPHSVSFNVKEKQPKTALQELPMANNEYDLIIVTVVITVILLLCLLGILFTYRYKMRNKDNSRNSAGITLEGLEGAQNPARQNIYILE